MGVFQYRFGQVFLGIQLRDRCVIVIPRLRILLAVVHKVLACWQWANFVESQQDLTQRVVYVNMDETMIRFWQGGRREFVKVEPLGERKWFLDREERGSLSERRQNSSLIAFIADCPRAQALLPLIMCGAYGLDLE